ncbi:MAG: hypothetical protein ABIK62_02790 [candidate division WOR-3 bacterium]
MIRAIVARIAPVLIGLVVLSAFTGMIRRHFASLSTLGATDQVREQAPSRQDGSGWPR